MLRQVTPNFYILSRKGDRWNEEQLKLLNKYNLKSLFRPIPLDFVKEAIQGYYYNNECITKPSKMIMLNFDTINNKKTSLRGILGVDFKPDNKKKYIVIKIIGCKSITNTPSYTVKNKHGVIMKTGKDMLKWWQDFAIKGNFDYIKLNAMEDVIGFYWKFGWRFLADSHASHAAPFNFIEERINKLNKINKMIHSDKVLIEKYRSKILYKYFDRYLEGYYKDTKRNYYTKDDIFDIYELNDTQNRHIIGLRYNGYPMYWFMDRKEN